MKRIIILIFFISTSFFTFSQDYVLFPTDSIKWFIDSYSSGSSNNENVELRGIDTVINGKEYSTVFIENGNSTSSNIGLLREEDKKVYFKINMDYSNDFDSAEIVLFDFSLSIGDTFYLPKPYFIDSSEAYTVLENIELIEMNDGSMRKKFVMSPFSNTGAFNLLYSDCGGQLKWVEGIGAINEDLGYSFHPFYFLKCSFSSRETRCIVEKGDTILGNCDILNSLSPFVENKNIRIFPNPANEILSVQFPHKTILAKAKVYNFNGALTLQSTLRYGNNRISVKGLKQGVYILKIELSNQILTETFIKID